MASYSDNFDRLDGEIGASWTEDNGDIDIVSNRAENQTSGNWNCARYASALDSADHYSEVYIQQQGGGGTPDGGALARKASGTLTCYAAWYIEAYSASGYRIFKLVSGSTTELDTAASTIGERLLRLTVDGSTQSMTVDGVEVNSSADSAITSGPYAGIIGFSNRSSFNNWSAADLAAAASARVPFRRLNILLRLCLSMFNLIWRCFK